TAIPYMYHCHLLTHEDDGMMGQFVVENTTGISAALSSEALTIYPNPSDGLINVKYEGELSLDNIEIIDPLGRLVLDVKISLQGDVVQIESLPRGLFFLRITANGQQISKRILVR
ncbi:MAG TPA: T9SS type A sorting domain-containing protein, partial [Bacteroidetes bacterium]|nr:T9SS type A sorting domain-containing protein [Bacteroidota bacterium]